MPKRYLYVLRVEMKRGDLLDRPQTYLCLLPDQTSFLVCTTDYCVVTFFFFSFSKNQKHSETKYIESATSKEPRVCFMIHLTWILVEMLTMIYTEYLRILLSSCLSLSVVDILLTSFFSKTNISFSYLFLHCHLFLFSSFYRFLIFDFLLVFLTV